MTVEVNQIELAAIQLQEAWRLVPAQISRLNKEVQLCDQETSDLLHLIEFTKFHASEGYKISRDLQITRQKRRQLKNELAGLNRLVERMDKSRTFIDTTNVLTSVIEGHHIRIKNKSYTPKVRSDLIERFSKL